MKELAEQRKIELKEKEERKKLENLKKKGTSSRLLSRKIVSMVDRKILK
jgi:hypothetical protein